MLGLNKRASIWRINYEADDIVGGAVTTGTLQYIDVRCRFQEEPAETLLVQQQGLQINQIYTATIQPGTLDIRERDEFELTRPLNDPHVGKRFRVMLSRHSNFTPRDRRAYIMLTLTRSDRAHDNLRQ